MSPLRINKTPTASPTKGSGRPLSEIGPTEHRRNSPSWNQTTKVLSRLAFRPCVAANVAKKTYLTKESSPFRDSSPFTNSPRLFWKEQTVSPKSRFETSENEYEGSSPSTLSPKRNSIENLKKQSRVKNSNMFAREQKYEYDPTAVQPLDRPLATGRPLSTAVQGNAYDGNGLAGLREANAGGSIRGHRRGESLSKIPTFSPSKASPTKLFSQSAYSSPVKSKPSPPEGRVSPTKSSLVSNGRFNSPQYNPDASIMSEDEEFKHQTPRPLRRHAKSVTFDTAPPTITEYEMVTPDPSAASGSREGSYESEEEEEMSFDQDDSFDASLEDTDKTPVVLPEDWRHMSPEAANTSLTDLYDDVFDQRDNSPMPTAHPSGALNDARRGSTNSEGDCRPLPPLPSLQALDDRRRRDSSIGLSAAAERVSDARRSLPSPPQAAGISKADLLNFRESSMSLEDRLRLMNFDDDRDTSTPTQETQNRKIETTIEVQVAEVEITESEITIDEPKVPRISRESILRRVKSRTFDDYEESYNYDAEYSPERSYGDLADLDPDVPIPSREASSNFDETAHNLSTVEESEADSVIDAYSFADMTGVDGADITGVDGVDMTEVDDTEISRLEDYERESSVIRHPVKQDQEDSDDASQYSPQPEEQPTSQSTIDSSGPPTPTAANMSPSAADKQARQDELFSSFEGNAVDLSLDPLKASFAIAPSPMDTAPKMDAMREFLRRPATPEGQDDEEMESDGPGTPDSVIRHPVVISPPEQDSSPEVPQREATIRGAGGKLKTRPSLIPDEIDMAATRRIVSGGHAPPVPERSPKRQSLVLEMGHVDDEDTQVSISNKENRMLDLNFGDESNDLSFGLDREFDHIIDAQKVHNLFPLPPFARFPTSTVVLPDGVSQMSGEGFVYSNEPANIIPQQQKGYLMRQNTKMVVASSRQFSDEKPSTPTEASADQPAKASPRKTSAERKPAWTKEPWNGKPRRKSVRTASGRRTQASSGPAPPLPGQESAVAAGLDSVAEQGDEEFEEGEERGRVFVKVVGVKDLDLPLPKCMYSQIQRLILC